VNVTYHAFRPNFVISGGEAFEEDEWKEIRIGKENFLSIGGCNRCRMVCVNPKTLEIGEEPLRTLSSYRREGGRIVFGIHLLHVEQGKRGIVRVGDDVKILKVVDKK